MSAAHSAGLAALPARLSAIGSCLAAAWTVLTIVTGGVRVAVGSHVVSSHDPWRPAVIAAALYGIALLTARAGDRSAPWAWIAALVTRASPGLAVVASIGVLWFGIADGARAAGGADALGYVSQAYLWLAGDLRIEESISRTANWPFAAESAAPLAYMPGPIRGTIVPTYAAGTPLLMAAAVKAAGDCGPFHVAPVFGALLVLATWILARRLTGDPVASGMAAILTATSPTLLLNVPLPMSDTVTAALWMLALALLTAPHLAAAIGAGLASGLAVIARPNLAPLVLAAALAAMLWNREGARGRRLLAFAVAVSPGVIGAAMINDHLYGSPLQSGYAGLESMFALVNVPGNFQRYAAWTVESQTALVLLAVVPFVVRAARPVPLTVPRALPLVFYAVLLAAGYLFYLQFDSWLFLRFFLPGLPLLYMLVGLTLSWLLRMRRAAITVPLAVLLICWLALYALAFAYRHGATQVGPGERRFAAVAEFVHRTLPPNAAIIARQHGGALAFYTGRQTLRFDFLPRQRLTSVVDWLTSNGYRPYIVLEDWEEPVYRLRFSAAQDSVSRLDVALVAETVQGIKVRVYDPSRSAEGNLPPATIDVADAPACLPPAPPWR